MKRLWPNLIGLAVLTACTVHPLTPTPVATSTLPAVAVVVATYTPTITPPPTKTPVLTATAPPTITSSPTAPAAPISAATRPTAAEVVAVSVAPSAASPPAPALPEPTWTSAASPPAADIAAAEQYTVDLINAQRAAAGVAPLARDETLMSIARARVADMVARGYTGHNDPVTGAPLARDMMRAAGYTSAYLGENWYGSIRPPPAIVEVAMNWFMTDPPHARNILSPNYTGVGVGIGYNGRQWLLIQNFAGPNQ